MSTHGICYSPGTGSPWWRCWPRGPSGWRTVTSPDLEAAQTSCEPRAASRCLRAGWCCGRSLWSGISMGARTSVANPCPYMPSMQTGNTQTHRAYVSGHNNCSPACVACSVFPHTPLPWLFLIYVFITLQRSSSSCWCPRVSVSLRHFLSSPELLALGWRQRPSAHTADGDPAHQGGCRVCEHPLEMMQNWNKKWLSSDLS